MKILLFIFAILRIPCATYALSDKDTIRLQNFYLGFGFGEGKKGVLSGFGLTWILNNQWGINISNRTYGIKAIELPIDYHCDSYYSICKSTDDLKNFSAQLTKQFSTPIKQLRYGFELGPSLITYKTAHFRPDNYLFRNYKTSYTNKVSAGLNIRAKLEFPLLTFFGVEFALVSNTNKFKSFIGYEIYLNLGFLRKRIIQDYPYD